MNTQEFWKIIDASLAAGPTGSDEQIEVIAERLRALDAAEVCGFETELRARLVTLYTFPILQVNFIVQSYVSDDVFEDFRLWIILNGSSFYETALANPDDLADKIDVEDPVEEINGEPLIYVAEEVYGEKADDDFLDHVTYPPDPKIDDDWPPKEELEATFPKLFGKFWNEERIRKFHPDS